MKKYILRIAALVCVFLLTGCAMVSDEHVKLRDLDFTVLGEEVIPGQLKKLIEEKGGEPFKFTYTDTENLYICIGYGEQKGGGYSIAVDALYLTDSNVCVSTTLLGPSAEREADPNSTSFPYIVIKTEKLEQPVMFE